MKTFTKVINPGRVPCYHPHMDNYHAQVFCKIQLKERDRDREGLALSITGVEGPMSNGDVLGGCGQIVMHLLTNEFTNFGPGWDSEKVAKFLQIWDKWHLNDMNAGSRRQRAFLEAKKAEIMETDHLIQEAPHAYAAKAGFKSWYDMACKWLSDENLLVDQQVKIDGKTGYKYGTKWLFEPIPQDVYDFLRSLPDTETKPHWV